MEAKSRRHQKGDPRIEVGRQIAALRRLAGLSQEALAFESGLARSYLGGVERGQRNISLLNICRVARALQVRPSRLLETI